MLLRERLVVSLRKLILLAFAAIVSVKFMVLGNEESKPLSMFETCESQTRQ